LHEKFACEKVCKGTVYLQMIYICKNIVGIVMMRKCDNSIMLECENALIGFFDKEKYGS
jgi:hypothetical protein